MSIRHITQRDVSFWKEQMREIEARWGARISPEHSSNAEYRRDKVLADILECKIDIHCVAECFVKYEDIRQDYEHLREMFMQLQENQTFLLRVVTRLVKEEKEKSACNQATVSSARHAVASEG